MNFQLLSLILSIALSLISLGFLYIKSISKLKLATILRSQQNKHSINIQVAVFSAIAIIIGFLAAGYAGLLGAAIGISMGLAISAIYSFSESTDEYLENNHSFSVYSKFNFDVNLWKSVSSIFLSVFFVLILNHFFANFEIAIISTASFCGIYFLLSNVYKKNNASNSSLIGNISLVLAIASTILISFYLSPENSNLAYYPIFMVLITTAVFAIGSVFLKDKQTVLPQKYFSQWFYSIAIASAIIALPSSYFLWRSGDYNYISMYFSVISGFALSCILIYIGRYASENIKTGNLISSLTVSLSTVIATLLAVFADMLINFKLEGIYNMAVSILTAVCLMAIFYANHLPELTNTKGLSKEWLNDVKQINDKAEKENFLINWLQFTSLFIILIAINLLIFIKISDLNLIHYLTFWRFYMLGTIIGIILFFSDAYISIILALKEKMSSIYMLLMLGLSLLFIWLISFIDNLINIGIITGITIIFPFLFIIASISWMEKDYSKETEDTDSAEAAETTDLVSVFNSSAILISFIVLASLFLIG